MTYGPPFAVRPVRLLGVEFASPNRALVWLAFCAVGALAMFTRSLMDSLLAHTPLSQLTATEGLFYLAAAGVVLLLGGPRGSAGRPARVMSDRWLIFFAVAFAASFLWALAFPPVSDYDTVQACAIFRQTLVAAVGGFWLARRAVSTSGQAIPPIVLMTLAGALLAAIIVSGGVEAPTEQMDEAGVTYGKIVLPLSVEVTIGGNTGGLYLLLLLYLCSACLIAGRGLVLRSAALLGIGLFGYGILKLAFRAGIIAAPAGYLFMVILAWRRTAHEERKTRGLILASLLLVGAGVLAWLYFQDVVASFGQFQSGKLSFFSDGFSGISDVNTITARRDQYTEWAETILRHPFGYGLMGEYFDVTTIRMPHSLLLKLLIFSGWAGLVCYLAAMIGMVRYWYRRLPHVVPAARPVLLAMIAANVTLLGLSWGYDILSRYGILFTYSLLCGLATAVAAENDPACQPQPTPPGASPRWP